MKYLMLDAGQKKALLSDRLLRYETEHYQHDLNARLLEASGDASDESVAAITAARQAMSVIEVAHAEVESELASLDGTD